MNYSKLGLVISTVLMVGAAGASISGIFTTSNLVTNSIVEKTSPPEVNSKAILSKTLDIKKMVLTEDEGVLLDTEVNTQSVSSIISTLESISKNKKEVFLLINSPGGSVIDGAKLISYMESSKTKINTVCIGICASMAAHIHQAGAKRFMEDRSILMFHPASGRAQGTMNEMLSLLNALDLYTNRMDAFAAKRAGIDYNEFKLRVIKNYWLEAQDAVANHMADGLVFVVLPNKVQTAISVGEKLGGKFAPKKTIEVFNNDFTY